MITYPTIARPARPSVLPALFSRYAAVIALVLWTFVPLLRRLVQWPTSYGAGNALTLLPPLFAVAAVIHERRRIKCTRLVTMSILATAVSFIYAFLISIFANNWLSGLYAFVDFTVPFAAATLVLRKPEKASAETEIERYFTYLRCVAYITLIVAVYGIVQYMNPLPWDTKWITDSGMTSIGNPRPFEVRVFSVLNSPGILGTFLALAILHLLPLAKRCPRLAYSAVLCSLAASALSLLRAGWVALALGLAVYAVFSINRLTFLKILAITSLTIFATFQILLNTPGLESVTTVLTQRFATLTDVEHDASAINREDQIEQALNLTRLNPIGFGLGVYGNSTSLSSVDGSAGIIDSGYLARSVEMGWLGFVLYLAPFVLFAFFLLFGKLTAMGTGSRIDADTDHLALAAGCLAVLFALNEFGDFNRGVIEYLGFAPLFFAAALQSRQTGDAAYAASNRHVAKSARLPVRSSVRPIRVIRDAEVAQTPLSTQTPPKPQRLAWLDILRFLCTIEIVGFHWLRACVAVHFFGPNVTYSLVRPYKDIGLGLGQLSFLKIDHWHTGFGLALNNIFGLCFGFGYEFVNVLIFVSGLSLAMTLPSAAIPWLTWLRRRVARVLIPYYAISIPLLLALEAFRLVADHVRKPALDAVYSKLAQQTATNPIEMFGSHIFLIDPLRPQFVTQFFSPAWWFIPAIIVAYLSFPLFLLASRKVSPPILLITAAGVSIGTYMLCQKGILLDNAWYFIVLNECFAFTAGILIGSALKNPAFPALFERRMASLPAAVLGCVFFCVGNVFNWYHLVFPEASLLFTTGCVLLSCWLAIRLQGYAIIRKICAPDAYYLYLSHQPLAFPIALIVSKSHLQAMPFLGGIVYIVIAVAVASALAAFAGRLSRRQRRLA